MKKLISILSFFALALSLSAVEAVRMEPPFWWTGMQNSELQILFYGQNIARSDLQFNYPGVRLKEMVRVENPNYIFAYLEVSKDAAPGVVEFNFTEGRRRQTKTFELKARTVTTGAQGFDTSDVMYLIMPDRFANGDPSNDVWDGVPIERHEPFGRHGGDIAGIEQRLDYIKDLGLTAIWLNPVLENKMPRGSYHGYATTDFYRVDPRFGTNEDYRRMIESAHQKGIKVVMDIILNHSGSGHWWMNDFPTSDWLNNQGGFVQTTHHLFTVMDKYAPQSEIDAMTDGWFVRTMPDLNQRNRLLADYLIQNNIWWVEYSRIDGIRHDTHPYVDFEFLARWSKRLLEEFPNLNIVGEAWYASGVPQAWWQRNSSINDRETYLKAIMDFNLMTAYNQAFDINSTENNPWRRIYEVLAHDFIYEDTDNILTFLDNHDTSRFFKKEETDLDRFKQAFAFLLTTRGVPQIYYGTEILMYGEKSEGDGNLRKDFPGGWAEDPVNAFTAAGRTTMQNEAFNFLRKLLQWRKTNEAVISGKLLHYVPDWNTQCYVYARIADNNRVLVILNGSNREQNLPVQRFWEVLGDAASGKDIISEKIIDLKNAIAVPAKGALVIEY